jgi:glycerophosphoryl diester phosphodiesterase
LQQLRELDIYHWRTDVPEVSEDRTRIMTLEQLLELTTSHHTLVRLAIETKHPVRTAGAIERELARLLRRFGIHADRERVMTMSFSKMAVKRSAALLPDISHVYLVEKQNAHIRNATVPTGASITGPDVQFVLDDPTFVERNHSRNQRVYVWTVDDPGVASRCRALGVDMLATNRPGELQGF